VHHTWEKGTYDHFVACAHFLVLMLFVSVSTMEEIDRHTPSTKCAGRKRDVHVCMSNCTGSVFDWIMKTILACLHCMSWVILTLLLAMLKRWPLSTLCYYAGLKSAMATPDSSKFCYTCHVVTSPATD